jgi:hypothetical protein
MDPLGLRQDPGEPLFPTAHLAMFWVLRWEVQTQLGCDTRLQ